MSAAQIVELELPAERAPWEASWGAALVVGVCFAASAIAGLQLRGHGIAAPFWPAAGVAAAGAILLGRRGVLAVLVASLATTTWNLSGTGNLVAAFAHGTGAALQAAATAFLVQRFVPHYTRLLSARASALFVLLIGPVSCAVNGVLIAGVLAALGLGVVPSARDAVIWWIGDAVGVMTVTPIVMSFFARPRSCWRPRVLQMSAPLFVVLLAVVTAILFTQARSEHEAEAAAMLQGERQAAEFRSRVDQVSELVYGTRALFESSNQVTADEYAAFVRRPMRRMNGLLALLWLEPAPGGWELVYSAHAVDAPRFDQGWSGDPAVSRFAASAQGPTWSDAIGTTSDERRYALFAVPATAGAAQLGVGRVIGAVDTTSLAAGLSDSGRWATCVEGPGVEWREGCADAAEYASRVTVGGASWQLFIAPTAAEILERERSLVAMYALTGGIVFTIAFALLALTGRNIALGAETQGRKRAEAEAVALVEEIHAVNQELDAFARMASHDLRSPLRAIRAIATWVREDAEDKLGEESREQLELLARRVERMDQMVDGLFRFAVAGREPHDVTEFEFADIVATCAEQSDLRGFTVEVKDARRIRGRRTPLEQVFRNLLSNAARHHDHASGRIVVSARRDGAFVLFRVADDGPGIPITKHDLVFEPFKKLRSRDEVEGSGMGLATVRRLVEAEGGKVWIEANRPRGTVIAFTWPAEVSFDPNDRPPRRPVSTSDGA